MDIEASLGWIIRQRLLCQAIPRRANTNAHRLARQACQVATLDTVSCCFSCFQVGHTECVWMPNDTRHFWYFYQKGSKPFSPRAQTTSRAEQTWRGGAVPPPVRAHRRGGRSTRFSPSRPWSRTSIPIFPPASSARNASLSRHPVSLSACRWSMPVFLIS